MPYDTEPASASERPAPQQRVGGAAAVPPEVYSLFESLNGELIRQKVMFESELRRQRESMGGRITKLELELEHRDAECKSLQNSVTILGRSLDTITEALERVAPNLTHHNGAAPAKQTRGRSPAPRSGSSQRQPSPRPSSATRQPSPVRRAASTGIRPPSPDARRSGTPVHKRGDSTSPATLDHRGKIGGGGGGGGAHRGGPVPVIGGKKKTAAAMVHKGATPVSEGNADYVAGIRYPRFLQSSVFPPEGMEFMQGKASQLPNAKLELQHIYGCSVDGYNDNVFYGGAHKVLTFAAAVGITIDTDTKQQKFSFHHTSEVCSMAVHPNLNLVATGQKCSGLKQPTATKVAVWDIHTLQCKATLKDFHDSGIACMSFSPDGTLLATVGGDQHHTLTVYRWATKEVVADARVSGEAVYNVAFNPFNPNILIVMGRRTLKFVELPFGNKTSMKVRHASMGDGQSLHNQRVVAGAFINADTVVTGTDQGTLLVWKHEKLHNVIPDAHAGGVSSLRAVYSSDNAPSAEMLVCSGRDGVVRVWHDVSKLSLGASSAHDIASILKNKTHITSAENCMEEALRVVTTGKAPVRSMDIKVERDGSTVTAVKAICMLFSNQIVEIDLLSKEKSRNLSIVMQGHSAFPTTSLQASDVGGDATFSNVVGAVASHPTFPLAVTVGSDCTLRFWNTITRRLSHIVQMPGRGLCADVSPDGAYVAVGLEAGTVPSGKFHNGGALVFKLVAHSDGEVASCQVLRRLSESEGSNVYAVKFDLQSKRLAVGGGAMRVDIYDVAHGCKLAAQTSGHSSEVLRIDWSLDSQMVQTDDGTPEHMYFGKDGQRITSPALIRTSSWGRWTCAYGWHVQGIWDDKMAPSHVTAVDRTQGSDLCVVGDSFPLPGPQASHKKYRGHCEEVTGIAFSGNGNSLFSSASDGCLFQWAVCTVAPATPTSGSV